MGNRTEYYFEADFCKQMAEKSRTAGNRERWLELAEKWLALADESHGDGLFKNFAAATERMRSKP